MMAMKVLLSTTLLLTCCGMIYADNAKDASFCDQKLSNVVLYNGYVTCTCKAGYLGNGISCIPLAACPSTGCCPGGTMWDTAQNKCVDINECTSADLFMNKCVPSSGCTNFNGGYRCKLNYPEVQCPGGPCPPDMDCLNVAGSAVCSDPCYHFQLLDGSTRLSNTSSAGIFQSDREIYGWHRYKGMSGVWMQGGNVAGGLKCGSAKPFSLAASHPALGEGIKSVPLQMNMLDGSPQIIGSLLVKACPQDTLSNGFYIYQFTGQANSEVFCTDPSTTPLTLLPTLTTTTTTTATTTPKPSTLSQSSSIPSLPNSSTTKPSTPKPSTATPSTPRSSTTKPSTPRPSSPKPSTPGSSTTKPSTPTPSTPKPSTPGSSPTKPPTPRPSTPKTSLPWFTLTRPSTPKFLTPGSSPIKPSTPKPSTPRPSTPGQMIRGPTVTIIQTETEHKIKATTNTRNVNGMLTVRTIIKETTRTTTTITVITRGTTKKTTVFSNSYFITTLPIDTLVMANNQNTTEYSLQVNETPTTGIEQWLQYCPFVQEPVSTITTTEKNTLALAGRTITFTITTTVSKQTTIQVDNPESPSCLLKN